MQGETEMLDVVYGSGDHNKLAQCLRECIQHMNLEGTLYFSYPTFRVANTNELKRVDALLVSKNGEITVFDLSTNRRNGRSVSKWAIEIKNKQSELHRNIDVLFRKNLDRSRVQKSIIDFRVITIIDGFPKEKLKGKIKLATINTLQNVLESDRPLENQQIDAINSAIHGITKSSYNNSKGRTQYKGFDASIFDIIDGKVACLDKTQIQAALSCPKGPQRIRGLAGSGKTTVLALKAAHLHIANPDWNIVITYRNVALGPYIESLIQRFMKGIAQKKPNWSKLHIVEAFGRDKSFFENVVHYHDLSIDSEKSRIGRDPFNRVFKQSIEQLKKIQPHKKLYDAILIDDAQELPASFFKFSYEAARHPKRIIWVADELQSLIGYTALSIEDLFGSDENGRPRVTIENEKDQVPQNIVLGTCYRSTAQALTVAHAFACGIHRKPKSGKDKSILQMYDDPNFWQDVGYRVVDGNLDHGELVSLRRGSSRNVINRVASFKKKVRPNNTIYFKHFDRTVIQWRWISERIYSDIIERKLLPKDILIIFPDLSAAFDGHSYISEMLERAKIKSDIIRPPMTRDRIFERNSVKISNIFGAKELEFRVVYFASAQEFYDGTNIAKMRNSLYTGITRSSGWVRLCGVGRMGKMLENEFRSIIKDKYTLNFTYPTQQEMNSMKDRLFQARVPKTEIKKRLHELVNMIENDQISVDALPLHIGKIME